MSDSRRGRCWNAILTCALVLVGYAHAQADAIALSGISAALTVTPATGAVQFDPTAFEAFATAKAQNSLGELDDRFDLQIGAPATIDATVLWAKAHGDVSNLFSRANSSVTLPGSVPAAASSAGQGQWFNTFTLTGGTGQAPVMLSLEVNGLLHLLTDSVGTLAATEIILNLLLDGETIGFSHVLQSIGPNEAFSDSFSATLTASRDLNFNTAEPYSLLLRVDSESRAVNAVPEPAMLTLLAVGLGAGLRRLVKSGSARREMQ
jgi:hypothetical protein